MAQPKKKTSKSKTHSRRAHHSLKPINLVACPQCNEPKRPHVACPKCGFYNGREVISIKTE